MKGNIYTYRDDSVLERKKHMAEYLAPGVYVEEFDSGVKAMEGVSTSTAGFIGLAQRGPTVGKPVLVTSYGEFQRVFGGYLPSSFKEQRYLAYSVEQFFNNGGSSAYVMRVASKKDTCAKSELTVGDAVIHLQAASVGEWGNKLQVKLQRNHERNSIVLKDGIEKNSYVVKNADNFQIGELVELSDGEQGSFYKILDIHEQTIVLNTTLEGKYLAEEPLASPKLYAVQYNFWCGLGDCEEAYTGVALLPELQNSLDHMLVKSQLCKATLETIEKISAYQTLDETICAENGLSLSFQQGTTSFIENDPSIFLGEDLGTGKRTGLSAFQEISDASIMCIPGITLPAVQSALVGYCEGRTSCFAILDIPFDHTTVDEILTHRSYFDSNYGAMYHPWLHYYDPLEKRNFFIPPSGVMAGIYARCDSERGVFKAPANEPVRGCIGLSATYNEAEQGKCNPQGVNLIRSIPGSGIRVWGARTISSDSNWKYINVRRSLIYIEESIKASISWAVFEPNDQLLWSRVQGTITMFLTTLWRNGALVGTTPEEAFFVNVGKSTMTEDDILNGKLICEIGVAPERPTEFVIFRITQKMETVCKAVKEQNR